MLLLTSLVEFYFYPQVYFYNPIFGFFPGTIYDEDLAVNTKLILHQLFTLVLFGGVVVVKQKYAETVKNYIAALFTLILLAAVFLLKPVLGFATTNDTLINKLKTKITTDHFEIFLGDSVKKSEYEFIGLLHEYYYEQVTQRLQVTETPKIASYIFNDKHQKREMFGAGNANVSKPWMDKIFLNYTNYRLALKHEIVHSVAAEFGVTPFKVADNINTAMIEGLAMFIENDFDGYPVSYTAKLAYNNGYKIQLENLFDSGKFFTNYSSLAYIYSGAFLEFISDKFGIKKIKELYGDLNFEKVVGENLLSLSKQFETRLADSTLTSKKHEAQLYFGGQTIFKKFCPRTASNDMKEAQLMFAEKSYDKAADKYLSIYNYSYSPNALLGYISSLKKQNKNKIAVVKLQKEINHFLASQYLYNLELQLADSYLLDGDSLKSYEYYNLIESQKPHPNYVSRIKLIKLVLSELGLETVKKFLIADESSRTEIVLNLYKKTGLLFLVPYILDSENLRAEDVKIIVGNIKDELDTLGSDVATVLIEISQYLLKKRNFSDAKILAVKAVNLKPLYRIDYAIENLRMVNWFLNFAGETNLKVDHIK
jgi:hypothetical protein